MNKNQNSISIIVLLNKGDEKDLLTNLKNFKKYLDLGACQIIFVVNGLGKSGQDVLSEFSVMQGIDVIFLKKKISNLEAQLVGVALAAGTYYFMMNINDEVSEDVFSVINKSIEESKISNPDTLRLGVNVVGNVNPKYKLPLNTALAKGEYKKSFYIEQSCYEDDDFVFPYMYVFRKDFILDLELNYVIHSVQNAGIELNSDLLLITIALAKSNTIVVIKDQLYTCNLLKHLITLDNFDSQIEMLSKSIDDHFEMLLISEDTLKIYCVANPSMLCKKLCSILDARTEYLQDVRQYLKQVKKIL